MNQYRIVRAYLYTSHVGQSPFAIQLRVSEESFNPNVSGLSGGSGRSVRSEQHFQLQNHRKFLYYMFLIKYSPAQGKSFVFALSRTGRERFDDQSRFPN